MTKRVKAGFTLIELLVVIAIIAILAGILFPVFAKAREKAMQTTCVSNQKQIAMAFMMYVTDWNQRWPSAGNYLNRRDSDWVWQAGGTAGNMAVEDGSLFNYTKNAEAYVCPQGKESAEKSASGTRTSYTMNGNLVSHSGSNAWLGSKVNRVKFPAQTFLLIEEQDETIGASTGGYNDGLFWAPQVGGGSTFDLPPGENEDTERHGGGATAAYCDGHVKFHQYSEIAAYVDRSAGVNDANRGALYWYYFPRRSQPDGP